VQDQELNNVNNHQDLDHNNISTFNEHNSTSTFIPPFSWIHRNHTVPDTVGHNNILFDGMFRKTKSRINGKANGENLMEKPVVVQR
jgi:hypothetical protein